MTVFILWRIQKDFDETATKEIAGIFLPKNIPVRIREDLKAVEFALAEDGFCAWFLVRLKDGVYTVEVTDDVEPILGYDLPKTITASGSGGSLESALTVSDAKATIILEELKLTKKLP